MADRYLRHVFQHRSLRAALIGGGVGAVLGFGAWRAFSAWLLSVADAPAPATRCLRLADSTYAPAIAAAARRLVATMHAQRIPGMTVAIAVDGQLIWSEGFGFADAAARTPACPETRFRLASVSKPITAVVMARLSEAGKLDLDAPITRYVPSFPEKGEITARLLAGHRAGIRHYRDDDEAFTTRHFASVTESVELFRDDPLRFPPGERHEYSSYGYALLGAALEGASGLPFADVLRQYVTDPLRLTHTGLDTSDSTSPHPVGATRFYDHVTPYVLDGQVHPSPFVDMSSKWAGGGMLSTSEDLVRFGSALLPNAAPSFLRPTTRDTLFMPMTRLVPPIFGYAMGWITARDAELRRVYMHFGAGSGATAWLGIYPDQRVVIAVLANLGHAGLPYSSSVGLGAHFAARPLGITALVLAIAFLAFAFAAVVLRWIIHVARSRRIQRSSA